MKIVIPGGSGQVGTILARHFHASGDDVVVLSRNARQAAWRVVDWDGVTVGAWRDEIDGADVVVNLAGRSVNCRYHTANRRAIYYSRVDATRAVGRAIAECRRPPAVWLQMSTATIYSHRYDTPQDESSGILGGCEPNAPSTWRFSIDVAKAWEQAAEEFSTPGTRRVLMRSAMVLSPDRGGVFDTLRRLVRLRLGGAAGDGRQYISWIHEFDFVRAVEWLIDRDLSGIVNVAAPGPLPNVEFMRALRHADGVRLGLPATEWMIEIGAWLLRTESELILKSRRVVPGRLLHDGFEFGYPNWPAAVAELCSRRLVGTVAHAQAVHHSTT